MHLPADYHRPRPTYSRQDLLRSSAGGYFGPGNAQLPAPPMLMMDRITEISLDGGRYAKGHVVAELDITPDLWFFSCHFPGDPVMPGCLGLDAMWQVVGFGLGWSGSPGKGRASGVGEVKFRGQITPDTSLVRYDISRDDQVALESEINRLHALYDAEIPRSEFEIRLGRGDYLGRIWIGRVSKDRRAIFPVVTDS